MSFSNATSQFLEPVGHKGRRWMLLVLAVLFGVLAGLWTDQAVAANPSFAAIARMQEHEDSTYVNSDGLSFYGDSFRDGVDGQNRAFDQVCEKGDNGVTQRIIFCMRRAVDSGVAAFFEVFNPQLMAYLAAMVLLAITMFGMQLMGGAEESVAKAVFTMAFKVGGVVLFTQQFGGFWNDLFPIMESLAGYTASYLTQGNYSDFLSSCAYGGGEDIRNIWGLVDCLTERMFLASQPVLAVLFVAMLFTNVIGFFVFFFAIEMVLAFIFLILRCAWLFIAAYFYLAFLVIISPLIIPLLLFKKTTQYFQKWLQQFVSMLIQPMILFGFMAFFFATLDGLFFADNDYSLASILGSDWYEPVVGSSADAVQSREEYIRITGDESEDNYNSYVRSMSRDTLVRVGILRIEERQLIDINFNFPDQLPGEGLPLLGGAIEAVGDITGAIFETAASKIGDMLFPFTVPVLAVDGDRSLWNVLLDLLKFFIIAMIFLRLMKKFADDIPALLQYLSSGRRVPGAVLPGERQVYGAVGAVKGAAVGAVKGAVTGGKVGAIKGAAEGAIQGYRQGAQKPGGATSGISRSAIKGDGGDGNIHAKEGQNARAVLHGKKKLDAEGGKVGGGNIKEALGKAFDKGMVAKSKVGDAKGAQNLLGKLKEKISSKGKAEGGGESKAQSFARPGGSTESGGGSEGGGGGGIPGGGGGGAPGAG